MLATSAELFDIFVGDDRFHGLGCFNFMNASHRALQDVVFLFEPGKEAGDVPADIVNGRFAAVVNALVIDQILSNFFGRYFLDSRVDRSKEVPDGHLIILQGSFRAAFDLFGIQEHLHVFFVGGR